MKLRSIETTPSPNCIKLNLDEPMSDKPLTLKRESDISDITDTPEVLQQLLSITGVQSVFLLRDFITLTRKGNVDWQPILATAAELLGMAEGAGASLSDRLAQSPLTESSEPSSTSTFETAQARTQHFGQVEVAVQVFRRIPVQVRAIAADGQQAAIAMPDRFNQALQRAVLATQADYVAERRWAPYQPQFGNPEEVARLVADELAILIDDRELAQIEEGAINSVNSSAIDRKETETDTISSKHSQQALLEDLRQADWKCRLKSIQQISVDSETFPAVVLALKDERHTIRRWAAAILGSSQRSDAVEPLCQVILSDPSPIVRRTAGDALSDLGNTQASRTMIETLTDSSNLVRWRAARFLSELGDISALEPLKQAVEDESEFDVRTEMRVAIERIQAGGETQLPMWMRITQDLQ
jgi:Virulence factor/HEAT repeats/Scaffold protein Nfu/NifU N terminal